MLAQKDISLRNGITFVLICNMCLLSKGSLSVCEESLSVVQQQVGCLQVSSLHFLHFLLMVSVQVKELQGQVEQEGRRRIKLQSEIKQYETAQQAWRTKERQLQQVLRVTILKEN